MLSLLFSGRDCGSSQWSRRGAEGSGDLYLSIGSRQFEVGGKDMAGGTMIGRATYTLGLGLSKLLQLGVDKGASKGPVAW